ncbi:proteic killer suppression protein [Methylobacterium sp. ap11]|uniref:type II toxin-antitoxin system RelE/ParE family toxin n=1 Tax=Methylobacterium sp. ap11 TaxID=1761799 RepID=UPI0008B5DD62|nr:type II toxin-antitoxin system RelE/ParE family toxin [Methylobacterium sp. ap11]SEO44545.1 proteic killer suppression protein [Methylobacterium sp. ap11]
MAIQSFADERTEAVFRGRAPKGLPATIVGTARRTLKMLDAARILDDLKQPPGNKLHPLERDRLGQHAIWINSQYRLCFRWTEAGPDRVEIVDYH